MKISGTVSGTVWGPVRPPFLHQENTAVSRLKSRPSRLTLLTAMFSSGWFLFLTQVLTISDNPRMCLEKKTTDATLSFGKNLLIVAVEVLWW